MAAPEEVNFEAMSSERGSAEDRVRQAFIRLVWFPIAYLIFGVVGLLTSGVGLLLSFLLPAKLGRPLGQKLIHGLFAFFVWFLGQTGIAECQFEGLAELRNWRGGIIIANHPCLIDVVLMVSQLPRVFCLMKQGLVSNIVLCGTARLAGYVDNHSAKVMVRSCAAKLQAGETLLIFPEGTRTVNPGVNSFKMGFALLAKRASAPVQAVFISTDSPFLGKHWFLLKPPARFPVKYSLKLGQLFPAPAGMDPKTFGNLVEDYYRASLVGGPTAGKEAA